MDDEKDAGDVESEKGSGAVKFEKSKALASGPVPCPAENCVKEFVVSGRSDGKSCPSNVLQFILLLSSRSINATPPSVEGCEFAGDD